MHRQALEGERRRKEGDGARGEGIPASQSLGPHMQAHGSQSPGHLGPHQLDTTPIQSVGEPGSFAQTQEREIEVRERTSWKGSVPKGSYEISSTEFLFNSFNVF